MEEEKTEGESIVEETHRDEAEGTATPQEAPEQPKEAETPEAEPESEPAKV